MLDPLFAFLAARCGNRDIALEALQETAQAALQAERAGKSWPDDEVLWAWLIAVARNKLADQFRRRGRGPTFAALGMDANLVQQMVRDGTALPPELAGRNEAAQLCRAALSELPPKQQEVLQGFYARGEAQAELASKLGVSTKAVESMLARAREAVRKCLSRMARNPEDLL